MRFRDKAALAYLSLLLAPALVLIDPARALAEQLPEVGSPLPPVLEAVLLIGLTLFAGGYGILKRTDASRSKFVRILKSVVGITAGTLVFLFAFTSAGAGFFAIVVFSIYGIIRGVQLITWGLAARKSPRPVYLDGVSPGRLLASGVVLLALTPVIFGYGIFSAGRSQQPYIKRGHAYQINNEAKNAYNAAQTYLAENPRAVDVTCADIEKVYRISAELACRSDMTLNSGGITITGPESWGLSSPSAAISYSGELTPARP